MTPRRRILILDDEKKVAFFLRESLDTLGYEFEVVSVTSTREALREVRRKPFDLVITDQNLPGMKGLELIERVQERSPETRFILITAYGSEELLAQARRLGAYHYLTKPFHVEEFVQTVLDALQEGNGVPRQALPDRHVDVLNVRLEELRREVGAQCVAASTANGAIVTQAGGLSDSYMEELVHLAADDFGTSLAMARLLGGTHTGNLSYYEGVRYDVYIANVEDDLFLVIVFDRRVQASRIGIVWLYARRAIENIRRVRSATPVRVGLD